MTPPGSSSSWFLSAPLFDSSYRLLLFLVTPLLGSSSPWFLLFQASPLGSSSPSWLLFLTPPGWLVAPSTTCSSFWFFLLVPLPPDSSLRLLLLLIQHHSPGSSTHLHPLTRRDGCGQPDSTNSFLATKQLLVSGGIPYQRTIWIIDLYNISKN